VKQKLNNRSTLRIFKIGITGSQTGGVEVGKIPFFHVICRVHKKENHLPNYHCILLRIINEARLFHQI